MNNQLKFETFKGREILPYLNQLATLRIEIFSEYPYLYEGNLDYETKYLKTYAECSESIIVLVFDQHKVVGASTAIPLIYETEEWQKPFLEHSIKVDTIFYLGESVLYPQYRGQHIYRCFFKYREEAAVSYGCQYAAFCSVERDFNDPRCPKNYQSLEPVWKHFGYRKQPDLTAYFEWKEIGENRMSPKPLSFWLKSLQTSR